SLGSPAGDLGHSAAEEDVPMSRLLTCVLLALTIPVGIGSLFAQAPGDRQKYEEAIRSAQQSEMVGYVLGVVGILLVVAAIPVGIYFDRRKKARKQAERQRADDAASNP